MLFRSGVAIDLAESPPDRIQDVVGDLPRHRVGVLVDVQSDRQWRLRCAVWGKTPQVIAEREIIEANRHPSHRTVRDGAALGSAALLTAYTRGG